MKLFAAPLMESSQWSVTESLEPDWSADVNYFIPWHYLATTEPKGPSIIFYTHVNPGMESGLRLACTRASHIVAMTEFGKTELENLIITTPITVIHAPIRGFSPRKRNILIVGAEQPNGRKRSHLLLDLAWTMDLKDFHFTIIGTGWEDVVTKLRNCGVIVEHLESISDVQMRSVYQNSDALLVTGYTEGGPLPVLEALASGLKVISPPYGYALDYPNDTYTYRDLDQLQRCLEALTDIPNTRHDSVSDHNPTTYVSEMNEVLMNVMKGRVAEVATRRPKSRYDWVGKLVEESGARYLMEIGTWTGESALRMIEAAKVMHKAENIYYYGYDLFRELTQEEIKREFSKQPWGKSLVAARLTHTGTNIYLHEGDTHETLHPTTPYNGGPMDFIFVDGGHSKETIRSDWEGIQPFIGPSTIILFDDCYYNSPDEVSVVGCQDLVNELKATPSWSVEYLDPVEPWPQVSDDGKPWTLHIGMVKVTRNV